jgi:predicted nucleic acid-binding protein
MIILDTNVLSEAMKPMPDTAVAAWLARGNAGDLYTTTITEAEILLGIAVLPDGRRKKDIGEAAKRIMALFADRILSFDSVAAQNFADIVAERRKHGRPINDFDAQIAAITRSQGMALATRNVADFDGIGLTIINPWIA